MSSSNCCFLTCTQVSQEAGQVVWYSISWRIVHSLSWSTVKGFDIVNKTEVDVFLERSCFFDDPTDAGNLISGSSTFSKSSLNIWKFIVQVLLKPGLENFEHYFARLRWVQLCGSLNILWHCLSLGLEKEMANHSSIHAWKIPRTEEPGGLQSMGSQRVRHDWATSVCVSMLVYMGLPWWLSGKESACQCKRCRSHGFNPWVRKILWRRKWQPTPVFLPE